MCIWYVRAEELLQRKIPSFNYFSPALIISMQVAVVNGQVGEVGAR
jgi:hypothetical protein